MPYFLSEILGSDLAHLYSSQCPESQGSISTADGASAPGILLFCFCFCRTKMSPEGGALTGVEPSSCLHMMNLAKLPFRLIYCFTAAYKSGSHV